MWISSQRVFERIPLERSWQFVLPGAIFLLMTGVPELFRDIPEPESPPGVGLRSSNRGRL